MENLSYLLQEGKTQFQVVSLCKRILEDKSFKQTDINSVGALTPGKYYITPYPSMLMAFTIPENPVGLRIAAAHTDFPMFKIKPNPEITKKGYKQINVEPYGGMIKESWFDRPLGMAGRVIVEGDTPFNNRNLMFDSDEPVCIIPSLAPHLSRGSKPSEIDIQKEMLPIYSCGIGDEINETTLISYVADKLGIQATEILDYELYLYICDKPVTIGINKEMLVSPRLDNISSVSAILSALCDSKITNCYQIGIFFDNEEIGSRSKQGADSFIFRDIITELIKDKRIIYDGICLSVDAAHGTHPNYTERYDITNDLVLGSGFVIKSSASQRYVTDCDATATIISLCRKNNIKYMRAANRSGIPGGQTLGPIMSSYLPIRAVDIGIPMLAMHSANELIAPKDYEELTRLIKLFYEA